MAAAAGLDTYRDFRLGASTADVLARASEGARELKTIHERPALLEELSWRPPHASAEPGDRDSLAGIVFSFIDDQLFKITVNYDRSRSAGLTKTDMIASLSTIYGQPTTPLPPAPPREYDSLDVSLVLALWRDTDTTITLHQTTYNRGFRMRPESCGNWRAGVTSC